jgi:C1A family cysteine protease
MNAQGFGGMGWSPDRPDFRDYTADSEKIREILGKSRPLKSLGKALPKMVDLREWCSPIEDQGDLGSCTANAGVGLMEYYQRRAFSKHLDGSRLFLYKVTRKLLKWDGDTGAFLRDTMKAMVLFGIPPEEYWPYKVQDLPPLPMPSPKPIRL